MLSFTCEPYMLGVVMLNVIILSDVAPQGTLFTIIHYLQNVRMD